MQAWLKTTLDQLVNDTSFVYRRGQPPASEPAALCALALLAQGRHDAAHRALQWLVEAQHSSGAVGVRRQSTDPQWPTALAILAWHLAVATDAAARDRFQLCVERAVPALLRLKGEAGKHTRDMIGHDPTFVAWAWVETTHSWIEPTALAVMALKASGHEQHPRVREAVRLLLDRQLASGGCNYGNTSVLGQPLRAHAQPSGMALVALAGEPDDVRLARSLKYLNENWRQPTPASLAWSLMGLAAHGTWPLEAHAQLERVATGPSSAGFGTYHRSLLALSAAGSNNPLLALRKTTSRRESL